MARRRGRILAFQALYSWDVGKNPLEQLFDFSWVDSETRARIGEESLTFARLLLAGTVEHCEEIDAVIERYTEHWDFDRIGKVDLAILRMSVYAMRYQKDIHPTIIIDEAVDITKEFSADESYKFINAVLDSIRKEGTGCAG